MHAPLRLASVVMVLAAGCRGQTPPPAQPRADAATSAAGAAGAAAAPRCTRDPSLLLPALALSSTLSLTDRGGRLAVDGTVTTVEWPGEPPRQHALADGRVVVN